MSTEAQIRLATAKRNRRAADYADADDEWREIIRKGFAENLFIGTIADAAGISRARAYQIRDGRRGPKVT